MSRRLSILSVPCLLLVCADIGLSATPVERGRYLTVNVGQCGDCHTPRLESGAPNTSKWLKGAALGVKPVGPVPGWASASPDLTSTSDLWKNWGEDAVIHFFVTGRGPDGKSPAPPMPAYTLTEEDARAVVAYLKSLK